MSLLNIRGGKIRQRIRATGRPPEPEHDTSEKNDGVIHMKLDPTPAANIRELELSYTERVNMAVAEDRYDLVDELAAEFELELQLLQPAA
jgi:hypothetical protein